MSDKKIIIRNCPCYVQYENSLHLCCDGQGDGECQDCTDCVMKQIVKTCEDEIKLVKKWQKETKYPFKPTVFELVEKILNQLDIQEVE